MARKKLTEGLRQKPNGVWEMSQKINGKRKWFSDKDPAKVWEKRDAYLRSVDSFVEEPIHDSPLFSEVAEAYDTAPLETMTKGRIYSTVNEDGTGLKSISYYDRENKRFKQIDLDHYHKIDGKPQKPHVQYGYYHDGKAATLSAKESKLLDRVLIAWHNKK